MFLLALLLSAVVYARPQAQESDLVFSLHDLVQKYGLDEVRSALDVVGSQQNTSDVYWWYFKHADCGYDDVQGSCQGQTVEGCEKTCLATEGCGGFNFPHGILKKTDCLQHKAYEQSTDLYVVSDSPQPPPMAAGWPPMWPHPSQYTNGTQTVTIDGAKFQFDTSTPCPDLQAAFDRYTPLFFPHPATGTPSGAVMSKVSVIVSDTSQELQLETDESYVLIIPSDGSAATITANTTFGAMRGLETLSQLVVFDFDKKVYYISESPWRVDDAPRFPHREVLLDSSRHFQPIPSLLHMIDSLPYAKINVVHWHIVDSQSFPVEVPSRPLLSSKGSWSNTERYTTEEVQMVVEYARQRAVRVMVEFDNPGHAASWCAGYPEICPSTSCLEPLNPSTEATFELIEDLFKDMTGGKRGAGLFPYNLMHLGGDEVNTDCWKNTPAVATWMQQHNYTTDDAYLYFVNRSQTIARAQGRDVVGWEEIWNYFGTKLDKSTIIHQWLPGSTSAQKAAAAGYRVLFSPDGPWYLDGLGSTWQSMYSQDPCHGISPDDCRNYVLGGGGEMWGETVDASDIQATVWPRLGAIGERLWSPAEVTDADAAHPRFSAFRCLLNRRGIGAAPSNNANARSAPPGPGPCQAQ